MKNEVNRTFMVKKTYMKYLALVLTVLGLSISSQVFATNMVLEATAFYGKDYTPSGAANTNNTWSPYTSGGTYGSCSTTANGVTISGSKMTVNSSNFKVQDGQAFTIQATSGTYLYRIVFKGASGAGASLTESNGILESNSDTWTCAQSYWGFTKGKTSVTFTNNSGVDYQINSINVYTYREATSAEASISVSSFTVNEGSEASKTTTLTTNLGPFDGANTPYYNDIDTDIDDNITSSTLQFDHNMYSTTYTNGSTISFDIYPYEAGTYTAAFILGKQSSSNTTVNYHMVAIWIPFTVIVNESCNQPTVAFTDAGPIAKVVTASNFTNGATVKYNSVGTGQTITYSSDNTTVASVNNTTGEVDVKAIGTAHITASVSKNSTYCAAEASYTLNVTGYSVTFHYPACAESSPANLTNQYGSVSLETDMAVSGYSFAGWTDHAVADAVSVTPLYTTSVTVSGNIDLYAVYSAVSNEFTLSTANPITAGDYVIAGSYNASTAPVMTNSLSNGKITANTSDYTVTSAGKLTCKEEECIWTLAAVSGGWTLRNVSNGKYLSAAGGAHASNDLKLRLVDSPDDYSVWTITQGSSNRYNVVNNKRNTDNEDRKNFYCNGTYFGFYTTISPFFFKRTTSASTYTSSPSCDMDEFTVTMVSSEGGTSSASGTGGVCVWDSPVLSKLYGSETVTITATPSTGYDFSSWTVVSGGASLGSTTTSPTTFTMPGNDVRIRPNFTPQEYSIEYRDKNGASAASFSGTHEVGYPTSHIYGTPTTLDEPTKTDYVFMGWFAEADCSGSRVSTLGATAYSSGPIVLYALWMQYSDPLAWCPEPEIHLTGDNVYITSTNGKSVKAVNTLTLNAINLVPGSTVRLSTPASSGIMFSKSGVKYNATEATVDFTADAGGDITDATVYVHYYPTTAGSGTPADVTVTAEYQTNTDYYSTKDVHVRNMPSAFVIAAKAGGSWYALPANIASATNPASVMIDVDESSWTAKGPSTLAYELWPVKSTTGDADRYADYGEKVRFSGNSDKGLWASTSSNTLNNYAAISGIGTGSATTNYEWNVATETDGSTWKYTLKMEGQSNFLDLHSDASGLIWGSYSSNVATQDIYLIPLTPIEPITLKVVEWYPTKVLVKTANDISTATVSINGTPVDKTITKKSGASCELYEISGLTTLTSNPTKTLTVSYTSGSTYAASVKIPVIIWESQNLVNPSGDPIGGYRPLNEPFASLTKEVYSYADLVVRDGATLTINGTSPQNTFFDVTIYPTSKISVPATNANGASNVFNIHSLTFFGGIDDIYNGSTYTENKYGVPELSLKGSFGTKTVTTINYDMRVDDRQMYSIAVPYDVDLADITYWDGTSMGALGSKLWVSAYDGQARANKDMGNTWIWEVNFESKGLETKLKQGIGYTISADYQASMGNQTSIIRMPMKSNVAASATEAAKTAPVTAYVNTQGVTVGDNNKGWNLVGNPYMVSISGGEPGSQLVLGKLVESGTGPWDWDGTTYPYRYVTIPFDDGTDYYQMKFKDATLRPFKNFFVQIDNTTDGNALGFALASRQDAPARFLQVAEQEVEVEILLSNDTRHDNMGLLIAEKYSPAYEINADLEKMIGSMAVYTIFGGYNLAYNALSPDDAKQFIPVGYVAPTAGEYTFSLDDESDVNEIEHIFLTDYQANVTVDLMEQDYTFTTGSGKNESRFVLNTTLKEKHETPTDIDIINSGGDLNADEPFKFIYRDKMYILRNGVIYDATGKKVREINK